MTVNAQRSLRLIPKTDFSRLTGNKGELFYDPVNNTLRIFNSQLVGGEIIATRTWVNSTIAAGVINYNNLTNKPVLFSGSYNDLTNKPNIAGTYQFSVAADDSTQRLISTNEVIKFIGAGSITTASDAEGNITITGAGTSSLVNGAYTVSLGSTGVLTFPNGALKIAGNKIRNVNESVGLILGSEIEVTVDKTVISNGLTDIEGLSNQHIFEVGSTRIFSALQVVNSLSEGGPSLTSQQLTELTSTGFKIGYRVINDLGEGEPLTSFSGWTFGTVGQSQALTFPDGTIQTTAPESFSFSVAADDSTQRAVSNNELVKFIGAGGVTTASDAEGNITINYVQGDIRSDSNINIDINLSDSTLRRWQFGEDGALTFPNGTNQTTAWTGIPGPYADDEAATLAGVALGSPYHKTGTGGQVFVRLTSPS